MMITLDTIIQTCDAITESSKFKDFKGAHNGLQVANSGKVTKIGAAVDASLNSIQKAAEQDIDFLIVHHGLFWNAMLPVTATYYEKLKTLIKHDIAVYSSHLPLDAHQQIGNNASIAKLLNSEIIDWIFPYEGNPIAALVKLNMNREALKTLLKTTFSQSFKSIEYGSQAPTQVVICSGSGALLVSELKKQYNVDTLITGELRQHNFIDAEENELNLYLCGHYATEVFGVQNLAQKLSEAFSVPWSFIDSSCSL